MLSLIHSRKPFQIRGCSTNRCRTHDPSHMLLQCSHSMRCRWGLCLRLLRVRHPCPRASRSQFLSIHNRSVLLLRRSRLGVLITATSSANRIANRMANRDASVCGSGSFRLHDSSLRARSTSPSRCGSVSYPEAPSRWRTAFSTRSLSAFSGSPLPHRRRSVFSQSPKLGSRCLTQSCRNRGQIFSANRYHALIYTKPNQAQPIGTIASAALGYPHVEVP